MAASSLTRMVASALLVLMVAGQPLALALPPAQAHSPPGTGGRAPQAGGEPWAEPPGGLAAPRGPQAPGSGGWLEPHLEDGGGYGSIHIRNPDTLNFTVPIAGLPDLRLIPVVALVGPAGIEPGWNGVRSGDGSEGNPYLVSGWVVDSRLYRAGVLDYAVYLANIPGYVVLENLTVYGDIYIFNVSHVILRNVTVVEPEGWKPGSGGDRYGSLAFSTSNLTIVDSRIGSIYENVFRSNASHILTIENSEVDSMYISSSPTYIYGSVVENADFHYYPPALKGDTTIYVGNSSDIINLEALLYEYYSPPGEPANHSVSLIVRDSRVGLSGLRGLRLVSVRDSELNFLTINAYNVKTFEIVNSTASRLNLNLNDVSNATIKGVAGGEESEYSLATIDAANTNLTLADSLLTSYSSLLSISGNSTATLANLEVEQAGSLASITPYYNTRSALSLTLANVTVTDHLYYTIYVSNRHQTISANISLYNVTALASFLMNLEDTWPGISITIRGSNLTSLRGPLFDEPTDLLSLHIDNSTIDGLPAVVYDGLEGAKVEGTFSYLEVRDSHNVTVNATAIILLRLEGVDNYTLSLPESMEAIHLHNTSNGVVELGADTIYSLLAIEASSGVDIRQASNSSGDSLPDVYNGLVLESSNISVSNVSTHDLELRETSGFTLYDTLLLGASFVAEAHDSGPILVSNVHVEGWRGAFSLRAVNSTSVTLEGVTSTYPSRVEVVLLNVTDAVLSNTSMEGRYVSLISMSTGNLTLRNLSLGLALAWEFRLAIYGRGSVEVENVSIDGSPVGYFEGSNLSDGDLAGLAGAIVVNSSVHITNASLPLRFLSAYDSNVTIDLAGSNAGNLHWLDLTGSRLHLANATMQAMLVAWESTLEVLGATLEYSGWSLFESTLQLEGSSASYTYFYIGGNTSIEAIDTVFYASQLKSWILHPTLTLNLTRTLIEDSSGYSSMVHRFIYANGFESIKATLRESNSTISNLIEYYSGSGEPPPASVVLEVRDSNIASLIENSWGGSVRVYNSNITGAIYIKGIEDATIVDSTITGPGSNIYIYKTRHVNLTGNTLYRVYLQIIATVNATVTGNTLRQSHAYVSLLDPWSLSPGSPENATASLAIAGNTFNGSVIPGEGQLRVSTGLTALWSGGGFATPNYTILIANNTFSNGDIGLWVEGDAVYYGGIRSVPVEP
ncbi:MAG: hypothetical protein LRS49_04390, partial [Desulfurococcales archaeon]|nr:hypothetical protein [Desulfurococcales archaeon]